MKVGKYTLKSSIRLRVSTIILGIDGVETIPKVSGGVKVAKKDRESVVVLRIPNFALQKLKAGRGLRNGHVG